MKVNDQLERAQFEQFSDGFPSGAQPTGRFGADVQDAAKAIPGFYNGTEWKTLAFKEVLNYPVINSGKEVTIDWANGLTQVLQLTANCLVKFLNPVEDQIHTLVVKQGPWAMNPPVTGNHFSYVFDMKDQETRGTPYQPGPLEPGKSTTHKWYYKTNVTPSLSTYVPSLWSGAYTNVSGVLYTGTFHPLNAEVYAAGYGTSPFWAVWNVAKMSNRTIPMRLNFPTAPQTMATAVFGCEFSPCGNFVAGVNSSAQYLWVMTYDIGTRSLTGAFAPTTGPTGIPAGVSWHPTGNYIAVAHATSPFITVYPFGSTSLNNTFYSSKLANPSVLPAGAGQCIAFNKQGDFLAIATSSSPFLQVYAFDAVLGTIGTIVLDPPTLPTGAATGNVKCLAWRPQGDYIAMGMTTSPYLYVVPFNRLTASFGTPLAIGVSLTTQAYSVQWSPDGEYLYFGNGTAPYMWVFDFGSKTIGTNLPYDSINCNALVRDITLTPDGGWAALNLNTNPYLAFWKLPNKQRNYFKLLE